jgi:hypothetical protein
MEIETQGFAPLRYQDCLIAWNPGTAQIRVDQRPNSEDGVDWTKFPIRYAKVGGAADAHVRRCKTSERRDLLLFVEFNSIVVRDRVPPQAAHEAFLQIDQYRQRISSDTQGAA